MDLSDRTTVEDTADWLRRALALHGIALHGLRANGTVVEVGTITRDDAVRLIRALCGGR